MLHAIQYHQGVDDLLELGLEYYQIAKLISEVLQSEFVINGDNGLLLTDKGVEKLEKLTQQLFPTNSPNWILPSDGNRVPKLDKFDIYLPQKKKFGK
jgi:hypothetical protein